MKQKTSHYAPNERFKARLVDVLFPANRLQKLFNDQRCVV